MSAGNGCHALPKSETVVPQCAVDFLRAIFVPSDTILFRPIETWTEAGKRMSMVDYQGIAHGCLPFVTTRLLPWQAERSETRRTNVFFGACPRFGGNGQFDEAWAIRTARALWADVDHCKPTEAIERCKAASVPAASIVVGSGVGTHLYWLLVEPYLINDVPDPLPIHREFIDQGPDKKKKLRRFIVDPATGGKLYLDARQNVPELSAKAIHFQDVLAGMSSRIGGDSTQDLSRLLRVPGTMNRKEQRNGRAPVPCELVSIDPSLRYTLADFERFAAESPQKKQREAVAQVPLPTVKKMTPTRIDHLNRLVAACSIAPIGQRSGADWNLCCTAIEKGWAKAEVWSAVQGVGKFAEQGEQYFERTWKKAAGHAREQIFDNLQSDGAGQSDEADTEEIATGNEKPVIVVNPTLQPTAALMRAVTDRLAAAGGFFCRAGELVLIRDDQIHAITTPERLAGVLNSVAEFRFSDGDPDHAAKYEPLPTRYATCWLNHPDEKARLPQISVFTRNPVYTEDWRLVGPGYDPESKIYYAGPKITPITTTENLDAMLSGFCFRNPTADRTNYLGMLLTSLLVVKFIGSKPAALFIANQPALGKTILAQIAAILRDGHPVETATYTPNDEEFEKRLGALVYRGLLALIIDNAKGRRGQEAFISSPCLERSITDAVLSFRLLGKSADIRAENSHLFCITANGPNMSRDLITRSVGINLFHEGDPGKRTFEIDDPEGYAETHRIELLGELAGMVERWKAAGKPPGNYRHRFNKRGWATIVGGILDVCGEPDFLGNMEDSARELDSARADVADLVTFMYEDRPNGETATGLVSQAVACRLLVDELGDGSLRSKATRLGILLGRFLGETFNPREDVTATLAKGKAGDRKTVLYFAKAGNSPDVSGRSCATTSGDLFHNSEKNTYVPDLPDVYQ